MLSLNFNLPMSYVMRGFEWVSPQIRKLSGDIQPKVQSIVVRDDDRGIRVDTKHVAELIQRGMQPIRYLFWASVICTGGSYVASKHTPIFSSVLKVATFISGFFTFDLFVTYALTYKEYYYFDKRAKERDRTIEWDEYITQVDDYSRGILSSTFLLNGSWLLEKDLDEGLVKVMTAVKDEESINADLAKEHIPGLFKWFYREPAAEQQRED